MGKKQDTAFSRARDTIIQEADTLKALLTVQEQNGIEVPINNLRNSVFEVAVIGVMKAGKSSFLNAMIKRPGLLPSDVNPWSAVVTHLHFGSPDGKEMGAEFTFYTENQWNELKQMKPSRTNRIYDKVKGAVSKTREKFFPDSDDIERQENEEIDREYKEQLKKKIESAQRKLGSELTRLLGNKHYLDNPRSATDLEPYLATGEEHVVNADKYGDDYKYPGKYADITWEANLWFSLYPFSEYSTWVDTPGTNDPDVVRSGLTEEYVSNAHAFVYIMSAPQAFAQFDKEQISYLVRGLYKQRMVVFINRLDNLNDPGKDSERVKKRVAEALKELFPECDIPVVIGSAYWGELALKESMESIEKLLDYKLKEYGKMHGVFTDNEFAEWRKNPEKHITKIREAAFMASGIIEIRQAIEDTILKTKGKTLLDSTRNFLVSYAEATSQKRDLIVTQFREQADSLEKGAHEAAKNLEQLEEDIHEIKTKSNRLQNVINKEIEDFQDEIEKGIHKLNESLNEAVLRFAESESRHVGISIFGDRYVIVTSSKCSELIQNKFESSYEALRNQVEKKEVELIQTLKRELMDIHEGLENRINFLYLSQIDPTPSLSAIRSVKFDLGNWFKRLLSGARTTSEKSQLLRSNIIASCEDALEGLANSVCKGVGSVVKHVRNNIEGCINEALHELEQNLKGRQKTLVCLIKEKDPKKFADEADRLRRQAEEAQKQSGLLNEFAHKIRKMPFV